MARIPNAFNVTLPLKQVIVAVAIDPDVVPAVKALTHTGKRGRPASTVNAKRVFQVLTKAKSATGLARLKEIVMR